MTDKLQVALEEILRVANAEGTALVAIALTVGEPPGIAFYRNFDGSQQQLADLLRTLGDRLAESGTVREISLSRVQ